jgi:hypothetical protein
VTTVVKGPPTRPRVCGCERTGEVVGMRSLASAGANRVTVQEVSQPWVHSRTAPTGPSLQRTRRYQG